jgi:hypothetical protein
MLIMEKAKLKAGRVYSESVFGLVEERRAAGSLNHFVNREKPIYQTSKSHPGLLEQVEPDGTVAVGRFRGGEFHPVKI